MDEVIKIKHINNDKICKNYKMHKKKNKNLKKIKHKIILIMLG